MSTTITIPSLTDELVAKIQSRIAAFLLCREKLVRMAKGTTISGVKSKEEIDIQALSSQQLQTQTDLEGKLSEVLGKIGVIQSGGSWGFDEISDIGVFYYNLERHIKAVGDLWTRFNNSGGGNGHASGNGTTTGTFPWKWIGAGVLIWLIVKRR